MISFSWGGSPPNPPLHGLRGLRGPVVRGLRGRVVVPGGVRCWLRQKGDSVLFTLYFSSFAEHALHTSHTPGPLVGHTACAQSHYILPRHTQDTSTPDLTVPSNMILL